MKYIFSIFILLTLSLCTSTEKKQTSSTPPNSVETENYELILPTIQQEGVLILFPGFPETPTRVKSEFKVVQPALNNGIAIVLMKFNQRLWLETSEKFRLASTINQLFNDHHLNGNRVFIGGFSSGGNISLLLANHLVETENIIQPKGVFIIDSPVDLLGLYNISKRNIQRNFSEVSVQESKRTVSRFEANLGKPEAGLENYESYAPYTHKTNNVNNLAHLKDVKIRLYTEPDIAWWKENRQNEWEDMNAFFLQNLSNELSKKFGNQVEYIATKNRGYRANGQRHPHSWAIVEVDNLLDWVMSD